MMYLKPAKVNKNNSESIPTKILYREQHLQDTKLKLKKKNEKSYRTAMRKIDQYKL